VLAGPRQLGKTNLIRGVIASTKVTTHYASADEPRIKERAWLQQQWDQARLMATETAGGAILVLDEIQKIPEWFEVAKALWDVDTRAAVLTSISRAWRCLPRHSPPPGRPRVNYSSVADLGGELL